MNDIDKKSRLNKLDKKLAYHNDQLGENASEEYANESYLNAPQTKGDPKHKKGKTGDGSVSR